MKKIEELGCCAACGQETKELKEQEDGMPPRKEKLCKLCAATMSGTCFFYQGNYPDAQVLHTLCYLFNLLFEKLEQK